MTRMLPRARLRSVADRLYRVDPNSLRGKACISYGRFSSPPQAFGDSADRQAEVRDRILMHFGMHLDREFFDGGLSGSKGHNRTQGQLGDLLELAQRGVIPELMPIIVEDIHRLSRELPVDVHGFLTDLVCNARLPIITGDMQIWDGYAMNSHLQHGLIARIVGNRDYADNLSRMARSVHKHRLEKLEALDPAMIEAESERPILSARPPAWITRTVTSKGVAKYTVLNDRADIVKLIFEWAKGGKNSIQIAADLNRRKIPTFSIGKRTPSRWNQTRISELLRNNAVLGYAHTAKGDFQLYPTIVELPDWYAVRDALAARSKLKGRKGKQIANLFSGNVFCRTCGTRLRAEGIDRLVCTTARETGLCPDNMRWDMAHFEPLIMRVLTQFIAPTKDQTTANELLAELGKLREIIDKQELHAKIEKSLIGESSTRAREYQRTTDELDRLYRQKDELEKRIASVSVDHSRVHEVFEFLKTAMFPALCGDVDGREQVRSLLARLDYKIVGEKGGEGMIVTVGERQFRIASPAEKDTRISRKRMLELCTETDPARRFSLFGILAAPFIGPLLK